MITIICFVFVFLIIYMVYLTFSDTITYEVFEFEQLPETFSNFTIFFIADIHRRKVNIKTLLKVKERIDLVMIGGDLVERGVPLKRMQENIRLLKHWKVPIFFVWGNNDYEVDIEEMTEILHEEKVIVLKDSYVKMKREIDEINIIGLDYDENFKKFPNVNWNNIDESFTLLLTHHPVSFYELDEQMKQKVDLVLAGHTHGGQIRFFTFGLYPKGGIYYDANIPIFITEGYGYTLLPFRFQTNAQCHVIKLQKKV